MGSTTASNLSTGDALSGLAVVGLQAIHKAIAEGKTPQMIQPELSPQPNPAGLPVRPPLEKPQAETPMQKPPVPKPPVHQPTLSRPQDLPTKPVVSMAPKGHHGTKMAVSIAPTGPKGVKSTVPNVPTGPKGVSNASIWSKGHPSSSPAQKRPASVSFTLPSRPGPRPK